MYIIGRKIKKERPLFVFFNETDGMTGDGVCYIFIFPQSFTSSFHVSDARDTVYDCHVVSVAWLEIIKQFRILSSCRLTFKWFLITDFNRSGGIIVGYFTVFNINARNTVCSSSHDIRIVESYIFECRRYCPVPVLCTRFVT